MDSFKSLVFRFAILASIIVMTNAAPWPVYARHPTHRIRTIGKRRTQVVTFQPKPLYKTFGASGIDDGNTVSPNQPWSLNDSVVSFVQSQLGIGPSEIGWKSGYSDDVAHYAFVKQHYDGIPFANAVANVAYNKNNKVVSFGSSFVNATSIAPSQPTVSFESVLPYIEELLGGQFNNHPPSLEYLVRPDMSVALTHVLQIQNTTDGTWYEAYICAHTGQLLSVNDFVAHASYTALPIQKLSVADGLEALTDPGDAISSPLGWNSDGSVNITVTSGNNVIAFKNVKSDSQQTSNQSSAVLNFQYTYNSSADATDPNNIDASRVNGFYVANMVHDIAYKYGFTEDAFNFQFDNLGRGGSNAKDGDGVLLSIQDPSGTNNANFATPPDGQSGICRMFIWDLLSPRRDGAMENDIVVHEMTHGITNRMTGGGTGRCLQSTEAAGLGEGWSDAMADWMQQKGATIADFAIGQYVTGNSHGVRHYPYSTDPNVNPLRYSDLQMTTDPHSVGEIWANMLHNVLAALVQERGFSTQALTNPDGPEGNVVFMHLFIDALALQPCNPTFVAARDAWIQADQTRFQGIHRCTLYSAFASRGLGSNAGDDFVDDDSVPADCFR
ncbi:Fungalysin metallopeptidase-domain-containing protein [Amanita rubescens]|nr:Fungalysin metallopeptidase-domain-containing protein [Amanita rubescens]